MFNKYLSALDEILKENCCTKVRNITTNHTKNPLSTGMPISLQGDQTVKCIRSHASAAFSSQAIFNYNT